MKWSNFLFPPKLADAEIHIAVPQSAKIVRAKFILNSLKLSKLNDYTEIRIPGLDSTLLQFVSGHPRVMSMVFYFDGRNTGADVRDPMKEISDLMSVDPAIHAPPVLLFKWKGFQLTCVLESVAEEFISQFSDGRPSLGKMRAKFKERNSVEQLIEEN